jgi:hypothetical protein
MPRPELTSAHSRDGCAFLFSEGPGNGHARTLHRPGRTWFSSVRSGIGDRAPVTVPRMGSLSTTTKNAHALLARCIGVPST